MEFFGYGMPLLTSSTALLLPILLLRLSQEILVQLLLPYCFPIICREYESSIGILAAAGQGLLDSIWT